MPQPPIGPPWDENPADPDTLHTTLPPQFQPTPTPSRLFFRGGFGSTCLPAGSIPPWVPGCNTTPVNMLMSFKLPYYWKLGDTPGNWPGAPADYPTPNMTGKQVVDAYLQRTCQLGYTHVLLDRKNWDAAGCSQQDVIDLFTYISSAFGVVMGGQSYPLFVTYWATSSEDNRQGGWSLVQPLIQPIFEALVAAGLGDVIVPLVGEELNNGCIPGPDGLDDIINGFSALTAPLGIPLGLHFTSNCPGWPADGTSVPDWYRGLVGKIKFVGWQADNTNFEQNLVATMGGHFADTRGYVYQGAGDQIVVAAFELTADSALYGRCTEVQARRVGCEMCCCTDPNGVPWPGVAGFMDGGAQPSPDFQTSVPI